MNSKTKTFSILLLILVVHSATAFAQGFILSFSSDKSTYFWEDSIWIDNDLSKKTHLYLSNHSTATLIKKSLFLNRGDRWQKEANTNLAITYNEKGKFSWGISGHNNYSRLEDRRVTVNRLGLHQNFEAAKGLRLSSLLAYSETSRYKSEQDDIDQGIMQKLEIAYINDLKSLGDLKLAYNQELNLLKRTPEKSFGLNLGYRKGGNKGKIRLDYNGNYKRSKFFSELTSFEKVTTQDKYEHLGDLSVTFNLLSDLEIRLLSTYSYRRFEYSHQDEEAASGLLGRDNLTATFYYNLGLSYPLFERSILKTEYIYRQSEEEFGDIFSGQNIDLGELRLSWRIRLGRRDSLYTSGTFSVTAYTGKDPSNLFSDRDRVFRLGQVGFWHKFSDHFMMHLRGSYQYNHNIHISKALSSNNNHNILYLAEPELVWQPTQQLQISQSWLMHANYIYYDYEKYEDSPRNTLYRKASYLVRINYAFSRRLDMLFSYRFRYEDFGQLIYRGQWAQRISWERKGHLPAIEFKWRPTPELCINPGFSYERKHSYDHLAGETEGESILREKELFKRRKIFININYRPGDKSSMELSYTRRIQRSIQFLDEDSDIFTVNVRRFF